VNERCCWAVTRWCERHSLSAISIAPKVYVDMPHLFKTPRRYVWAISWYTLFTSRVAGRAAAFCCAYGITTCCDRLPGWPLGCTHHASSNLSYVTSSATSAAHILRKHIHCYRNRYKQQAALAAPIAPGRAAAARGKRNNAWQERAKNKLCWQAYVKRALTRTLQSGGATAGSKPLRQNKHRGSKGRRHGYSLVATM